MDLRPFSSFTLGTDLKLDPALKALILCSAKETGSALS